MCMCVRNSVGAPCENDLLPVSSLSNGFAVFRCVGRKVGEVLRWVWGERFDVARP